MSFTNDDILVLARAGFTASHISALNKIGSTPATNPTPQLVNPAPAGAMTVPATNNNDTLNQILNAIQTNAINATQQPATQTTDDILAEIINPTVKE